MPRISFFLFIALVASMTCKNTTLPDSAPQAGELIFQSGFENDTVVSRGSDADIVGADKKLPGYKIYNAG